MQRFEFLIAEDNTNHKYDAIKTGRENGFDVIYHPRGSFSEFLIQLRYILRRGAITNLVVVTDLYIPFGEEPAKDGGHHYPGKQQPLGLLVMATCREHKIPCRIVTAGYHHGHDYNQICGSMRLLGWPEMIDSGDSRNPNDEGLRKNWAKAFQQLREEIGSFTP